MFSIAHRSASTSECNADSHRVKFRVPISCMSFLLSIQTHPHPLKRSEAVQDPSSKQILPKLKTWFTSLLLSRTCGGIISFALNQAWHSLSAYRTSSKGSLSIPLKSLSLRDFQIYHIIIPVLVWYNDIIFLPEKIVHVCVDARHWEYTWTCRSYR